MSMKEPDDGEVVDEPAVPAGDGVETSEVADALNKAFDAAEADEKAESEAAAPAVTAKSAEPAAAAPAATEPAAATPAAATPAAAFVQGPEISAAVLAGDWAKVDTTRPPSSLSVEAKAKFATLEEPIRKEILRLDANFHKGIEQYKTDAGFGKELQQIAQPYMAMIQAEGGTPAGAFRDLLNTAYQLRQNPQAVVKALAQQYGVELGPAAPAGDPAAQTNPEVAELRQRLAAFESKLTEGEQAQQQELRRAADEAMAKFAADPKNVYFTDVRASMASLIQSGEAKDYQDAYDKACWINPAIRQALTQQAADKAEQERIAKAKVKSADARRAAFDVSGSGAASNGKSELSLRQQLEAAFPE